MAPKSDEGSLLHVLRRRKPMSTSVLAMATYLICIDVITHAPAGATVADCAALAPFRSRWR